MLQIGEHCGSPLVGYGYTFGEEHHFRNSYYIAWTFVLCK
jgi:hypothetical protein